MALSKKTKFILPNENECLGEVTGMRDAWSYYWYQTGGWELQQAWRLLVLSSTPKPATGSRNTHLRDEIVFDSVRHSSQMDFRFSFGSDFILILWREDYLLE